MGGQYLGLGMDSTAVLCIVTVNDTVNESCIYCGYCEVDVKRLCVWKIFGCSQLILTVNKLSIYLLHLSSRLN